MDARPSKRALWTVPRHWLCCADYSPQHPLSPKALSKCDECDAGGNCRLRGPDRIAKLIAGAKKEGMVNVYTSETVEDVGALSLAFAAKYGVKLNVWRGSSEDILQRAVVERAAAGSMPMPSRPAPRRWNRCIANVCCNRSICRRPPIWRPRRSSRIANGSARATISLSPPRIRAHRRHRFAEELR